MAQGLYRAWGGGGWTSRKGKAEEWKQVDITQIFRLARSFGLSVIHLLKAYLVSLHEVDDKDGEVLEAAGGDGHSDALHQGGADLDLPPPLVQRPAGAGALSGCTGWFLTDPA